MEMKKKILISGVALVMAAAVILGGIKLYRIHERDEVGILLAFDDYNAPNWEEYFDLFDEYGVGVTFFINASEPTEFCSHAIERGHEIAFHTVGHVRLTELSEEEVYEEAIAPIEVFREKGFELSTFAYPYGAYNEELNERLLEHYKVLRGAYSLEYDGKHVYRKGFVESMSLDNGNYDSQEQYEERIMEILNELKGRKATVVSMYSHAIGAGDWSVSEEKLRFLLQKAKEMGVRFYTFQELQNW